MNILCTNDDGYGSIGIEHLIKACSGFGSVWVCAPNEQQSECSHRINTKKVLLPQKCKEQQFQLNGSPADCSRVGLCTSLFDVTFDMVCSGINAGGNLGVDIHYSGTVAAAREAHILGYPAISFSMVLAEEHEARWDLAQRGVEQTLKTWMEQGRPNELWNINFPSLFTEDTPLLQECQPERQGLQSTFEKHDEGGFRYSGRYHKRPKSSNSDVDYCFKGVGTKSVLRLF